MDAGSDDADNRAKNIKSIDRQRSITTDENVATTTGTPPSPSPPSTASVVGLMSACVLSSSQYANGDENKSFQNAVTLETATTQSPPTSPMLANVLTKDATALAETTTSANLTSSTVSSAQHSTTNDSSTAIVSASASGSNKVQIARRERRPDRAVYVPRARRSQTTPPTTAATMTTNIATTAAPTSSSSITETNPNTTASQHSQKFNSISSNVNSCLAVSTTPSSRADENTKKKFKAVKNLSNNNNHNNNCNPTTQATTIAATNVSITESATSTSSLSGGGALRTSIPIQTATSTATATTATSPYSEAANKERKTERCRKLMSDQIKDWLISPNCDRQQHQHQQHFNKELFENSAASPNTSSSFISPPQPLAIAQLNSLSFGTPNEMNSKTKKQQNHRRQQQQQQQQHLQQPLASAPSPSLQNGFSAGHQNVVPASNVENVSKILIEKIVSDERNLGHRHNVNPPPKCDIDQQELQRASKEINRSNRRIIKQTFVSDVLEIPEKIEVDSSTNLIVAPDIHTKIKPTAASTTFDSTTEDEEDDWESKYNESGDCLDPKILQELENAVGKVKISKPKTDYSAFLANQSILNDAEFPHVLEVSNFPVEFKNQDLLMVFSQYKESGFDIKWVDDTHALAVFSSSRIAAEVLTMGHPFVVLKPLAEASMESRLKAKKCASSLQPYKQRPETCAALARRLVTGALGVRLETAAAERENEKRVLRKAKERKLLAAKQRDEAWES